MASAVPWKESLAWTSERVHTFRAAPGDTQRLLPLALGEALQLEGRRDRGVAAAALSGAAWGVPTLWCPHTPRCWGARTTALRRASAASSCLTLSTGGGSGSLGSRRSSGKPGTVLCSMKPRSLASRSAGHCWYVQPVRVQRLAKGLRC